jgi:hypothetical protein
MERDLHPRNALAALKNARGAELAFWIERTRMGRNESATSSEWIAPNPAIWKFSKLDVALEVMGNAKAVLSVGKPLNVSIGVIREGLSRIVKA